MLNDFARDHLHGLLVASLNSCITSLGGVKSITAEQWNAMQGCRDARLVVLTLGGYRLRCLVCLLVDSRQATASMDDDTLQELANNLCGALKRYLGDGFHELGMSTPNALPVGCIAYLQKSEQSLIAVRGVAADGNALNACLLVLQADDNWVPPAKKPLASEPEALGELELF